MQKTLLIHNPRCSKSRSAKDILTQAGIDFDTIDYLKDGLKEKLLTNLPSLLGLSYKEMIRKNEEIYKELELDEKKLDHDEWIKVLIAHPILLERPIFIHNNQAVIGRPPERVLEIL